MLFHTGVRNYRNSSLTKLTHFVMDNKKNQKTNICWRPVCNQYNSNEGVSFNKVVPANQQARGISQCDMDQIDIVDGGSATPSLTNKKSVSIEVGASLISAIKRRRGLLQKIEEDTKVKITFPKSKKDDFMSIVGDLDENIAEASEKLRLITNETIQSSDLEYSHFVSLPLAIHTEMVDKLVDFQTLTLRNREPDDQMIDEESAEEGSESEEDSILKSSVGVGGVAELKSENDGGDVKVGMNSIPFSSYSAKPLKSSNSSDLRIDKSIFIRPKTLHLTVLMLKLWNKERMDKAAAVLQNVGPKVMDALGGKPVYVKLKGLECMKGSLSKARVLYIPVEEPDNEMRLLQACEVIRKEYVEAGLVIDKDAKQKLKLHATVMNVRHRKRKNKKGRWDWFDGREIVKRFGREEWGSYLIQEAHLSHMYAFDDNGYYSCSSSIPFPTAPDSPPIMTPHVASS